jgi:hypothetical protein
MHIGVMAHVQVASFRMMTLLLNLNSALRCAILSALLKLLALLLLLAKSLKWTSLLGVCAASIVLTDNVGSVLGSQK